MHTSASITYKLVIDPNITPYAVYFTVSSDPESGKINGLFVNSKEMTSFQWVTALMTSYVRQLNAGIELQAVIQDMKETFAPGGSYIIPSTGGIRATSIVHHLGLVLERYSETVCKSKI